MGSGAFRCQRRTLRPMAKMTAKRRNHLPKSAFALPSKRKYPIPDLAHARAALAYGARRDTAGAPSTIRKAVYKKFPSLKPGK